MPPRADADRVVEGGGVKNGNFSKCQETRKDAVDDPPCCVYENNVDQKEDEKRGPAALPPARRRPKNKHQQKCVRNVIFLKM